MGKIFKITEEQYNAYINGEGKSIIDEAMHYPEFLDDLKVEVESEIESKVYSLIRSKQTHVNFKIKLTNNTYFNFINTTITLEYGKDINENTNYKAYSNSNETLDEEGKIEEVFLEFTFPVSERNEANTGKIDITVSHEIGHLFDDYCDLTNGGKGVFHKESKSGINNVFYKNTRNTRDRLLKSIGFVVYMSISTEGNSFTQQIMQELKAVGANHNNLQDKFKETISYKNLKKCENEFFVALENTTDINLFHTNRRIIEGYHNVDVPKLNVGGFDASKYRQMLRKWAERNLRKVASRYIGVVQLYKDRLSEEYHRDNCFIVF